MAENQTSRADDVNNPEFVDGKNIRRALKNAQQALQVAFRLEKEDDKRDFERGRVLAAFNGVAPYDESEMLNAAQAYRFNVSFGYMEGVVGRATVPYEELVNDQLYIANIDADLPEEKLTMMRDEFWETVKKWGRWGKVMSRQIQDMVLNGYNTMIFPSIYDPWPVFIPQKDSYVHELTLNEIECLDVFVWKKSYLINELYEKIEDPEAATKAGWNVPNVQKALEDAAPADVFQRNMGGSWTALESAIRGGSLWSSICGAKQVSVRHVLVAEITGKVTHYIAWDSRQGQAGGQDSDTPGAELFKKEDRWDSFKDVLVYFDMEPGDGKWHGSKGVGRRAFNTHRAIDKLRCALLDQAFVSGLTILQPGDQASQEDFQLAVVGPFAVIPADVQIGSTTIPAISAQSFQVDALLTATSEQRIGDVVPSSSNPITGGDKTATQANIDNQRSLMISKSNLKRYLSPLSAMISIIVKRLLMENSPDSYAKEFQAALIEKGFTREDFKKVRGAKSTGRIDSILGEDKAMWDMFLATYRNDPDIEQKGLKRGQISAYGGPKEAESLIIQGPDKTKEIEAIREQKMEIGTMLDGIPVDASPRDLQEVHAAIGIDWLEGQIQNHIQGKPGADLPTLDAVAHHVGEHLAFMEKDATKRQMAKNVSERLKQIGNTLDKIEKEAASHIQANPPIPIESAASL